MQYHPDINKSPGAEEKFKEISSAYEVAVLHMNFKKHFSWSFIFLPNLVIFSRYSKSGNFLFFVDLFFCIVSRQFFCISNMVSHWWWESNYQIS